MFWVLQNRRIPTLWWTALQEGEILEFDMRIEDLFSTQSPGGNEGTRLKSKLPILVHQFKLGCPQIPRQKLNF